MLKFDNIDEIDAHIKKCILKTKPEAIKMISEEYLKDTNVVGAVPKREGFLIGSAQSSSNVNKGLIKWKTSYAPQVYYQNQTGIVRWAEVKGEENRDKYAKMHTKIVMDATKSK